jgi:hypothetical protein
LEYARQRLRLTHKLIAQIESDIQLLARCRSLFGREFAVEKAVRHIVAALASVDKLSQYMKIFDAYLLHGST